MTDRSLQTTIAVMCFAMVSIVAGAWALHLVTPHKAAPSPSSLIV